jgi:hypothetical protein
VQHHEQRWQTPAPVPATRYENPYPARPAGGTHARTQRWSAQLARTQDTATQTYYELAFGDGRLQVMLTEPLAASQDWAAGVHARPVEVLPVGTDQAGSTGWDAVDLRNSDAVRVAERILSDADRQAAEIHHEAAAQATAIREAAEREATEIRQQAAAQAVPVREAAEREAAEIRQQAAAQAAAVREAAEREATELRAHLLALSAELGRVAAYVTENLTSPATPVKAPPARPATAPAARPAAEPATKPQGQPAAKPAARPRQFVAMRRVSVGVAALVALALTAGITEVALHGYQFFVFRQGGTGSTPGTVIKDNQFLAREHHKVNAHQPVKAHEKAKALHKAKAGQHRHTNQPK